MEMAKTPKAIVKNNKAGDIKMSQVLVADKRYQGKYVAFDTKKGKKIVAFGEDVGKVILKASEKCTGTPAIVFVPKEDTAYVY